MKLTALIIDDELPARERLSRLIAPIDNIQLVGTAENAQQALALIKELNPQLIFLDISMPGTSGIQLAEQLRHQKSDIQIIFTTAFDEYALDAFEVDAKDYLLKPIRRERLQEAVKKLFPKVSNQQHVLVKDANSTIKIDLADILYLQADQKYTELHLANKTYLCSQSLKEYELQFPDTLIRVHRSTLINLSHLKGLEQKDNSLIVILNNCEHQPEVSRRHQSHIRKLFNSIP